MEKTKQNKKALTPLFSGGAPTPPQQQRRGRRGGGAGGGAPRPGLNGERSAAHTERWRCGTLRTMGCGCGRLLGVVCPLLLLLLLHVGECRGGWDAGAGLLLWGCERGLLSSRFSFPSLTPLPGWMWRCGNGGSLRRGSRSRTCASSPSLLPLFLLLSLLLSPLLSHNIPPLSLSHSKPELHLCLSPLSLPPPLSLLLPFHLS